jgi:hypothetical protein
MSVIDFSNPKKKFTEESDNSKRFEKLEDEIRKIEREKNTKWLTDSFPSQLKKSFREAPESKKETFYTLVNKWIEEKPKIKENFKLIESFNSCYQCPNATFHVSYKENYGHKVLKY